MVLVAEIGAALLKLGWLGFLTGLVVEHFSDPL
jgi:hypothetical protein